MTRTYALRKLLEHGPMTRREITECTGWTRDVVNHALRALMDSAAVRALSHMRDATGVRTVYGLA